MASRFGSDASTFAGEGGAIDCDPIGNTIEGGRAVVECGGRCLMSPNGSVPGCPGWGYDLMGALGGRVTPVRRERVRLDVEAELQKDERVRRAKVKDITLLGQQWVVRIVLHLADGSTFSLVMGVDKVSIDILGIQRVGSA